NFVKEAIRYGAVDYLIKLELSSTDLSNAIERAINRVREIKGVIDEKIDSVQVNLQNYRDKFFVRLYNNLFDSSEQYLRQKEDLQINFSYDAFAAVVCTIDNVREMGADKQATLCSSCM